MRVAALHTLAEVADRLRVRPRRLREYLRRRPCGRRLGRQILFTNQDVRALIDGLDPIAGQRHGDTTARGMARCAPEPLPQATPDLFSYLDANGGDFPPSAPRKTGQDVRPHPTTNFG